MTVEDLIRRIRTALNDYIEPYFVSDAQIFDWLNEAYLRVQMESTQWRFFEYHGKLLDLVADQATYALTSYNLVDYDSMYVMHPGGTNKWPVCRLPYNDWQQLNRVNYEPQGVPRYFVELPDAQLLFSPLPKESWELYGAAWLSPAKFVDKTSVPVWDETFHVLVMFEALKVAALEWPDEKQTARIMANVQANLTPLKRAFYQKYLPEFRGAAALI